MIRAPRAAEDGASRRTIVGALAERGPLSRSELAELTGIGAATVGTQVRRLLQMGLVRELEPQSLGTGRPRVPVALVERTRVIGVSIEPAQIVVAVTALDGGIVAERRTVFDPRAEDVTAIVAAVRAAMSDAAIDTCLAVGIALSGVVDAQHDGVLVSVVLDWHDRPLGSLVAAGLGLPVYVENDVLALASRELSFATLEREDSFLLVSLGAGVGMAIVAGRRVFRGAGTSSTEFGHVCVDPEGLTCRCGGIGCVQTVAGLQELVAAAPLPADAPRTLEALAGAADQGDPRVAAYLRSVGEVLGRAVGGSATLLGIGTILLTGESTRLWPRLSAGFDDGLRRHTTTLRDGTRVSTLPWSDTAGAAGAAGLALARALDATP